MFKRFSTKIEGSFFKKSRRWAGKFLIYYWQKNVSEPSRLAVIIKKSHQGLATSRHLIKRRIRQEINDLLKDGFEGLQLVVVSQPKCGILNQPQWQPTLIEELKYLIKQINSSK